MSSLAQKAQQFLADHFNEYQAAVRDTTSDKRVYFAPSDEPLNWKADRRKLVRLDKAILSLHLEVSRITFRTMPQTVKQKIAGVERKLSEMAVRQGLALSGLIGFFTNLNLLLGSEIFELGADAAVQADAERGIRRNSIRMMRELHSITFPPRDVGSRRHRHWVRSRHPQKKKHHVRAT